MARKCHSRSEWRRGGTAAACSRTRALNRILGNWDIKGISGFDLLNQRDKKMGNPEFIAESEVNVQCLAEIFGRAFMKTTDEDEGGLRVQTDGPRVLLRMEEKSKLLKIMALFGVKDSFSLADKHAFVNGINDNVVFARFSISGHRPDVLVAEYFLPYEEGVLAYQIVNAVRLFGHVVPAAIRNFDTNDMVE